MRTLAILTAVVLPAMSAMGAHYDMAVKECAVLSEIFKAECRLTAVQMPAPLVQLITSASPAQTATANYELRSR